MIEIVNISKSYKNKLILDKINLKIGDGDFISIIGKSGTGKTTLLNIIGGLESPESGEVILDGKKIKSKNMLSIHRHKIGFLFQNYALIEEKTVEYNLKIATKYNDKDKKDIDLALIDVGLKPEIKTKKVFQLSGGEQQRVAMARLILKDPEYILADEPTGNLDKENADIIFNCLKKLNELGKTIILVTHDLNLANMADRVVNLNQK